MVRKNNNVSDLKEKWLRNKNTIEFLGIWEEMYNADFNAADLGVYVNAVMVDIVCCVNHIHFYLSSFHCFLKAFQSVHDSRMFCVIMFYVILFPSFFPYQGS